MASDQICRPCSRLEETSSATNWCLDCEEPICESCVKAHKANKSSANHNISHIEAVTILPTNLFATLKECQSHPTSSIDFYCPEHEVLCCRRCLTEDHRSCDKIIPIEDACQNIKESSILYDTNKELEDLLAGYEDFVKERKQNLRNIEKQKKNIEEKILKVKQSFLTRLDAMETSSLKELNEICHQAITESKSEDTKTKENVELVKNYQQQIDFIINNGSNQLLFSYLNYLKSEINDRISGLNDSITKTVLSDIIFEEIGIISRDMNTMGTIKVQKTPCKTQMLSSKESHAQTVSVGLSKTIKSFKHEKDFNDHFTCVTAIDIDKNGNVLLADCDYLKMYTLQGKYIKQCKLDGSAWDLSCHRTSNRNVVALRSRKIQIIDNFIPQPAIPVNSLDSCYGITFTNDNIAVSEFCGKISLLDYSGNHIRTITTETKGVLFYLHHHQGRLYFTDNSDKVYCIKENGTHLQTVSVSELSGAVAVTTDYMGNIYVVGFHSNNVVQLSAESKNNKAVLKKEDGIYQPYALCFDRDYTRLFVSSRCGKDVKVFTCEY